MIDVDITSDLTAILSMLAQGVQFCFSFLSSIKFLGTDLLRFSISLLILGAIIPLIFSLVRSNVSESKVRRSSRSDSIESSGVKAVDNVSDVVNS